MIRSKLLIGAMIGFVLILTIACSGTEPRTPAIVPLPTPTVIPTATATPSANQVSRGAIAEAKRLKELVPHIEELISFRMNIISSNEDEYRQLINRLSVNDALASAVRTAEKEGIIITLNHKFDIGTLSVDIDIGATDEEIIEFLKYSLPKAKANKVAFQQLRNEASQFGITLMLWELDEYNQIRERLLTNNKLASALRAAAAEGVMVELERKFSVTANSVYINVDAADEEIIEFLLGK